MPRPRRPRHPPRSQRRFRPQSQLRFRPRFRLWSRRLRPRRTWPPRRRRPRHLHRHHRLRLRHPPPAAASQASSGSPLPRRRLQTCPSRGPYLPRASLPRPRSPGRRGSAGRPPATGCSPGISGSAQPCPRQRRPVRRPRTARWPLPRSTNWPAGLPSPYSSAGPTPASARPGWTCPPSTAARPAAPPALATRRRRDPRWRGPGLAAPRS
jgi:hypothetical protein